MEPINVEPTAHSPRIIFDLNGKLLLEGRSIPEDVDKLFNPLVEFIQNLTVEDVVFDINLEYFNTATSKCLLDLLKNLDANNRIENVLINWYYEADDEDSLEMAEMYEECLLKLEFRYVEYTQSLSLFEQRIIQSRV